MMNKGVGKSVDGHEIPFEAGKVTYMVKDIVNDGTSIITKCHALSQRTQIKSEQMFDRVT